MSDNKKRPSFTKYFSVGTNSAQSRLNSGFRDLLRQYWLEYHSALLGKITSITWKIYWSELSAPKERATVSALRFRAWLPA